MSFASIIKSCQPNECSDDDATREFETLDAFNAWYEASCAVKRDARKKNSKFDENDMKLLEAIEPKISDLYNELKYTFGDKGFFANDDFHGFTMAIIRNVHIEPDDDADEPLDDEYEWVEE